MDAFECEDFNRALRFLSFFLSFFGGERTTTFKQNACDDTL